MRLVIQRVRRASVTVGGEMKGRIGPGFLVLVGVQEGDGPEDVRYCAEKTAGLRVFEDAEGKMNLSLADVGGAVLAVSQFTLLADARHGRRPSFIAAARPETADPLYVDYCDALRGKGLTVETGVFRADMDVELVNQGPVTILIDSRKAF